MATAPSRDDSDSAEASALLPRLRLVWNRLRKDEIAESASLCALSGGVVGGIREWQRTTSLITEGAILQEEAKIRERYKDKSFSSPKLKRMLRYHASKEAHALRLLKVCTNATRWCASLGAIAGFYTTLEQVSGIARGEEDHWNDVAAGAMSGNVLGLCFPGTIGMRLRGAAVGSVAGGLLSLPLGFYKSYLNSSNLFHATNKEGSEQETSKSMQEEQEESHAPQVSQASPPTPEDKKKPGFLGRLVKRLKGG